MSRRSRMIIPGVPHHVTQRGNRRERIFFEPGDEALYLDLMSEQLRRRDVACWAYCLMPNRVHFILTPTDEDGLSRGGRGAPEIRGLHRRPGPMDGPSVPEPLLFGGDGRGSSAGGVPLCGA